MGGNEKHMKLCVLELFVNLFSNTFQNSVFSCFKCRFIVFSNTCRFSIVPRHRFQSFFVFPFFKSTHVRLVQTNLQTKQKTQVVNVRTQGVICAW